MSILAAPACNGSAATRRSGFKARIRSSENKKDFMAVSTVSDRMFLRSNVARLQATMLHYVRMVADPAPGLFVQLADRRRAAAVSVLDDAASSGVLLVGHFCRGGDRAVLATADRHGAGFGGAGRCSALPGERRCAPGCRRH